MGWLPEALKTCGESASNLGGPWMDLEAPRFGSCFDHSSTAKSSVAETALQHRRVPLGIISCVQPHQLVEGLVFWAGRNPLTLRERALHSRAHRSEAFAFASMQGTHIPVVGICLALTFPAFGCRPPSSSSAAPSPPGLSAGSSSATPSRLPGVWLSASFSSSAPSRPPGVCDDALCHQLTALRIK